MRAVAVLATRLQRTVHATTGALFHIGVADLAVDRRLLRQRIMSVSISCVTPGRSRCPALPQIRTSLPLDSRRLGLRPVPHRSMAYGIGSTASYR
jgi:hypothetical protein